MLQQFHEMDLLETPTRRGPSKASQERQDYTPLQSQDTPQYNDQFCFKCKQPGEVYCCDNCNRTYHPECLTPQSEPNTITTIRWQCPTCVLHELCPFCLDPVDMRNNSSLVCSVCFRLVHSKCFKTPQDLRNLGGVPGVAALVCTSCINAAGVKHLLDLRTIQDVNYCLVVPNSKIVQQIPSNFKKLFISSKNHSHLFSAFQFYLATTFLIIFYICLGSSLIHRTWISQKQLHEISGSCATNALRAESQRFSQLSNIDKILQVRPSLFYINCTLSEELDYLKNKPSVCRYGDPSNFKFLVKWMHLSSVEATWEDEAFVRANPRELQKFIYLKEFELRNTKNPEKLQPFTSINCQAPPTKQPQRTLMNFYDRRQSVYICDSDSQCRRMDEVLNLFRNILSSPGEILIFTSSDCIPKYESMLRNYLPSSFCTSMSGSEQNQGIVMQRQMTVYNPYVQGIPKFNILICNTQTLQRNYMYFLSKIRLEAKCVVFDEEEQRLKQLTPETISLFSSVFKILFLSKPPSEDNIQTVRKILCKQTEAALNLRQLKKLYSHQFARTASMVVQEPKQQLNSKVNVPILVMSSYQQKEAVIPKTGHHASSKGVQQAKDSAKNTPQVNIDGLTPYHKKAFLRFVLSFGLKFHNFESFYISIMKFSNSQFKNTVAMRELTKAYMRIFVTSVQTGVVDRRVDLENQDVTLVMKRVLQLSNLRSVFDEYNGHKRQQFPFKKNFNPFNNKQGERRLTFDWNYFDDIELIKQILNFGMGQWAEMVSNFMSHRELRGADYIMRRVNLNRRLTADAIQAFCVTILSERAHQLLEGLFDIAKHSVYR